MPTTMKLWMLPSHKVALSCEYDFPTFAEFQIMEQEIMARLNSAFNPCILSLPLSRNFVVFHTVKLKLVSRRVPSARLVLKKADYEWNVTVMWAKL